MKNIKKYITQLPFIFLYGGVCLSSEDIGITLLFIGFLMLFHILGYYLFEEDLK
jgi:hypothetical protein